MIGMTYDPAADAAYFYLGAKFAATEEAGPFIYDMDVDGRVIGIEILDASKVPVPDPWQQARMPRRVKQNPA